MTNIDSNWLSENISESTEDAWFWSVEWQAGEKQADADLQDGRFKECKTIDEVISFLHAEEEDRKPKERG